MHFAFEMLFMPVTHTQWRTKPDQRTTAIADLRQHMRVRIHKHTDMFLCFVPKLWASASEVSERR